MYNQNRLQNQNVSISNKNDRGNLVKFNPRQTKSGAVND